MLKIVLVVERFSIAENSALKPDTDYLDESHCGGLGPEGEDEFELDGPSVAVQRYIPRISRPVLV